MQQRLELSAVTDSSAVAFQNLEHMQRVAMQAARFHRVERADRAELEYIRRTQDEIELADGSFVAGEPLRLIRAYGPTGRLAVEWCTIGGTKYTDIDGKEL